jgi:hypothetical protein
LRVYAAAGAATVAMSRLAATKAEMISRTVGLSFRPLRREERLAQVCGRDVELDETV